ncbi:hypothetical protein MTO96_021251 [Rhipicephalus appendiculatus]
MKAPEQDLQAAVMQRGPYREAGPLFAVASIRAPHFHGPVLRVAHNEHLRTLETVLWLLTCPAFVLRILSLSPRTTGDRASGTADGSQRRPFSDVQSSLR